MIKLYPGDSVRITSDGVSDIRTILSVDSKGIDTENGYIEFDKYTVELLLTTFIKVN